MSKPSLSPHRAALPLGLTAVALACALLGAACGTAPRRATATRPVPVAATGSLSLATSAASAGAAWAVLPMGATAGPNQFWQLFRLTAGQVKWKLDTPPDIATNGAIAITGLSGTSLVTGVRPSLYLDFSPVSRTQDAGGHWTAGPPANGLASVPDALAAAPDGGQLLALSRTGQVTRTSAAGVSWSKLSTEQAVATTPAGQSCGLSGLTATAYSAAGVPLVAGACSRPGVAGIFAWSGGSWQAAGPVLPAALRGDAVTVLRLTAIGSTSSEVAALLRAGTGSSAQLVMAWLSRAGKWTVSAPLRLAGEQVLTTSFGAAGQAAATLSGGHAEIMAGPGSTWQETPPLPPGRTAIVALPAGGIADALVAAAGELAVWQLARHGSAWTKIQSIRVPIQYGSSS
jgi:hypothetical protein